MPLPTKLPRWASLVLVVFVAMVALRYMVAIDSGVGHLTALRTYVFWAGVTAPVAYLADLLGRTIFNYRFVRVLLARMHTDSTSNTSR